VLHGAADAANLQRIGKVDVIALFDVIEHLPQPRETLALCRDHLNPGGIIVITTGIMARWRRGSPARAGGS
jgi:2-polyprenyl-3-methyl-5-hydroxy-6-metoxy-1,4-benzoquinol methylase